MTEQIVWYRVLIVTMEKRQAITPWRNGGMGRTRRTDKRPRLMAKLRPLMEGDITGHSLVIFVNVEDVLEAVVGVVFVFILFALVGVAVWSSLFSLLLVLANRSSLGAVAERSISPESGTFNGTAKGEQGLMQWRMRRILLSLNQ